MGTIFNWEHKLQITSLKFNKKDNGRENTLILSLPNNRPWFSFKDSVFDFQKGDITF